GRRIEAGEGAQVEVVDEELDGGGDVGNLEIDVVQLHGAPHNADAGPRCDRGSHSMGEGQGSGREWPGLTRNRPAVFRSRGRLSARAGGVKTRRRHSEASASASPCLMAVRLRSGAPS